jgi:hypothetical protein
VTGAIPRRDLAGNEIDQDALFQEVESFGSRVAGFVGLKGVFEFKPLPNAAAPDEENKADDDAEDEDEESEGSSISGSKNRSAGPSLSKAAEKGDEAEEQATSKADETSSSPKPVATE